MGIERVIDKTFPACVDNMLDVVSEVLEKLGNVLGYKDVSNLFNVKIILNELLINAVTHGCGGDINKYVTINCYIKDDEKLVLKIVDQGKGYDYYTILKQELCDVFALDNMKESGRGILIVKNLCEDLNIYNNGSEIEVVLKI